MLVKVWGARGSIPVSGPQYVRYGGDTTCLEVVPSSKEVVIFDAGTGLRALGNDLLKRMPEGGVIHLFLTHAHWDHIIGFPFFKPLFKKNFTLKFHGCAHAQESIKSFFEATMKQPFFPVPIEYASATLEFSRVCTVETVIGDLRVRSIPMNHPNGGDGFIATGNGRGFAFFPDNELAFDHPGGLPFAEYARLFEGLDLLIHDAEYTPGEYARFSKSWGHSVFNDTVKLALEAGVKSLMLWHLNQDRDDAGMDSLVEAARAAAGTGLKVESAATGLTRTV